MKLVIQFTNDATISEVDELTEELDNVCKKYKHIIYEVGLNNPEEMNAEVR